MRAAPRQESRSVCVCYHYAAAVIIIIIIIINFIIVLLFSVPCTVPGANVCWVEGEQDGGERLSAQHPRSCLLLGRNISPAGCVSRGSHEPPGDVWFPPHSLLGTAGSSPSHQSPTGETKARTGTCSRVPLSQGGRGGPVPGRSRSSVFPVAAQGSPWSRPCLSKHVPPPRARTETRSSDRTVTQPRGTSGSWGPATFFHKCRDPARSHRAS